MVFTETLDPNVATAKLKEVLAEKRKLADQAKTLEAAAEEHKKARDEKNKQVAELKQKRNEVLQRAAEQTKELEKVLSEFSELEEKKRGVKGSYFVIEKSLKQLEWEYQTGAPGLKRERELVKQIEYFERQLTHLAEFKNAEKDVRHMQEALKEVNAEARVCHHALILHAEESEKHHVALKEALEKIRQNNEKIKALDEEAEGLRAQARFPQFPTKEREKELRRRAEKILEEFKSGKKITVEELNLLEQFDLY